MEAHVQSYRFSCSNESLNKSQAKPPSFHLVQNQATEIPRNGNSRTRILWQAQGEEKFGSAGSLAKLCGKTYKPLPQCAQLTSGLLQNNNVIDNLMIAKMYPSNEKKPNMY